MDDLGAGNVTMWYPRLGETVGSFSTLVLATGTLVCCALPIVLVMLGLGATVAALTSAAPWLVTLSHYKDWMFLGAAGAIGAALWSLHRPGRSCPAEPELARACARADRWNRIVVWTAAGLLIAGAFAAYAWLPLLMWWEG